MTLGMNSISRHVLTLLAALGLALAAGGRWTAYAAPLPSGGPSAPAAGPHVDDGASAPAAKKSARKELSGKLNLNTASEDQLMRLPSVGPAKADRIVAWRKKNGGFKRTADLRHVKGFGYKTFKKLEPFLDIKGETTLAEK